MKKGIINICIMLFGVILILLLTFTYLLYFQVGTLTKEIKEELYYALMNAKIELDKTDLSYGKFNLDEIKLEERLINWCEEIAESKINVDNIEIKELLTNINEDRTTVKIRLDVTFEPLIKIRENLKFSIEEEIDLMLLKYK